MVKTLIWEGNGCDELDCLYAYSLLKSNWRSQEHIPELIGQVPTHIKHDLAISTAITQKNFFKPMIYCANDAQFEQNFA